MTICAVGNQKGGVGKTTLTINLAVAFKEMGLDVVVIEIEGTTPISMWAADRESVSELSHIDVLHKTGKLAATLRNLDQKYDVVLVDTPGKDSPELRSALFAADVFLVPAVPSQLDVDTTVRMRRIVDEMEELNANLVTAAVVNCAEPHSQDTDANDTREMLCQSYDNVLSTMIGRRKIFRNAYVEGRGVLEMPARTESEKKAQDEIHNLAEEVKKLMEEK